MGLLLFPQGIIGLVNVSHIIKAHYATYSYVTIGKPSWAPCTHAILMYNSNSHY